MVAVLAAACACRRAHGCARVGRGLLIAGLHAHAVHLALHAWAFRTPSCVLRCALFIAFQAVPPTLR
eukprot:2419055-Alexandrium_andersonii.AAC.1